MAGKTYLTKQDIDSCYTKDSFRGKGAFGNVHVHKIRPEFENTEFRKRLVVKSIDEINSQSADREINNLKKLSNQPHIVQLLGYERYPFQIYMECLNTDLATFVKRRNFSLNRNDIFKIHEDILCGLKCLEQAGVLHRDIKPANILVDYSGSDGSKVEDLRFKVGDLGGSRPVNMDKLKQGESPDMTKDLGTPGFMAPEIIPLEGDDDRVGQYGIGLDVWGAGATIIYVASGGIKPLTQELLMELRFDINSDARRDSEIHSKIRECVKDEAICSILVESLKWNPRERWTPDQSIALIHFLRKHQVPTLEKKHEPVNIGDDVPAFHKTGNEVNQVQETMEEMAKANVEIMRGIRTHEDDIERKKAVIGDGDIKPSVKPSFDPHLFGGTELDKLICEGTFGHFYKRQVSDSTAYTVQKVDKTKMEPTLLEQNHWKSLDHQQILKFHLYYAQDLHYYLIMEPIEEAGTYADWIRNIRGSHNCGLDLRLDTSEYSMWRTVAGISSILSYLHNHKPTPIVARCLAPHDILATYQWDPRDCLTGLGIRLSPIGSTPAPPRKIDASGGSPDDIWMLGALIVFLITHGHTRLTTDAQALDWLDTVKAKKPKQYSKKFLHLLKKMLEVQPQKRPKADNILRQVTQKMIQKPFSHMIRSEHVKPFLSILNHLRHSFPRCSSGHSFHNARDQREAQARIQMEAIENHMISNPITAWRGNLVDVRGCLKTLRKEMRFVKKQASPVEMLEATCFMIVLYNMTINRKKLKKVSRRRQWKVRKLYFLSMCILFRGGSVPFGNLAYTCIVQSLVAKCPIPVCTERGECALEEAGMLVTGVSSVDSYFRFELNKTGCGISVSPQSVLTVSWLLICGIFMFHIWSLYTNGTQQEYHFTSALVMVALFSIYCIGLISVVIFNVDIYNKIKLNVLEDCFRASVSWMKERIPVFGNDQSNNSDSYSNSDSDSYSSSDDSDPDNYNWIFNDS